MTALRQKQNVQIVSPYFKSPNSKKIGLTNFFYVKLKSTTDIALLEQYAKQTKCIIVKQDDFMPLWYVLSCTKSSDKNAMELANQFFESGLFQFAEPDLMEEDILNCVNDTYFPQQWGLRNTGQYGGNAGIDIRACDAWNISTGSNIIVAVIDQGIQLDHPDLQANIHSLSYDTESRTSPSIVRGDHGTACAGIIGAVGNTAGVRGVEPNCRLMSVSNSLDATTISRMKRGEGINWAVQNGAHIISNSWESSLPIQIIEDAITNALTNGRGGLGCVVVFSTGNK
jgi:subtilisin family serine protease